MRSSVLLDAPQDNPPELDFETMNLLMQGMSLEKLARLFQSAQYATAGRLTLGEAVEQIGLCEAAG